jgi:hypothetical protein
MLVQFEHLFTIVRLSWPIIDGLLVPADITYDDGGLRSTEKT